MKSMVDIVYEAQTQVHDIPKLTTTFGDFDIPKAYQIQRELIGRYRADGLHIIGYKMGLTSREKMEQMGVDAPVHGVLFEEMLVNEAVDYAALIHPKAEPEIAFKMGKDVALDATADELLDSIEAVAPAIDIIDSRYENFIFTMADVVADNCSSAQFAVGKWQSFDPNALALDSISASLIINDELKATGVSSAVLGSPFIALQELHSSLAQEGIQLKAGQIVLSGAITAAYLMEQGDSITNQTDALGSLTIS